MKQFNPFLKFISTALILYILWYLLYEIWLHPAGNIDRLAINNLSSLSSFILKSIGYELNPMSSHDINRYIGINGTQGLWVGDSCNGISLFALFTGFIIAFPGKIKRKLLFIPFGLITIHILNVIRIVSLTLINYYSPEYLDFNHTYTFTILVYSYVFLLWMVWVNKFSKIKESY